METPVQLVIGLGEVGGAIYGLLTEKDPKNVYGMDIKHATVVLGKECDIIHVCFPYSPTFVNDVRVYVDMYLKQGGVVVVHSTVKVGTCEELGAVYSPVRGRHPNIIGGLKTFVKYFAGPNADPVARLFHSYGVNVGVYNGKSQSLEAAKLWDTTQYGWQIMLCKMIKKWCDEKGLDFDLVYTEFNISYNQGYSQMGMPEFVRPYLKHMPGKIGGHCVIQNLPLLDAEVGELIAKFNETLEPTVV